MLKKYIFKTSGNSNPNSSPPVWTFNLITETKSYIISYYKQRLSSIQSLRHVGLCDPMDCITSGFPVHHQLPEFTQSCPSSWWCHPAISSSLVPFSSCPQSLPASGTFPMSQHFAWGSQSIGVSVSASVLPMNIQDWFLLGLTGVDIEWFTSFGGKK